VCVSRISTTFIYFFTRRRRLIDRRHGDDGPPEGVRDALDLRVGHADLGVVVTASACSDMVTACSDVT